VAHKDPALLLADVMEHWEDEELFGGRCLVLVARPYALHTMPMGNSDPDVQAVVRASSALNYAGLQESITKLVFLPHTMNGTASLVRALLMGDKVPKNATGQAFVTATSAVKAMQKASDCDIIVAASQSLADAVNAAEFNSLRTDGKRTAIVPIRAHSLMGEDVPITNVASTLPVVLEHFAEGQHVRVLSDDYPPSESPFGSIISFDADAVVVQLTSGKKLRVERTVSGGYDTAGRLVSISYIPLAAALAVNVQSLAQHHFDKPALYFRGRTGDAAPPPHVILAMLACCRNPAAAVYINVTHEHAWFGSSGLLHMWGAGVAPTASRRLAAASASIAVHTMLSRATQHSSAHGKQLTDASLLVSLPWDKAAPTEEQLADHRVDVRAILRASEVAMTAGSGGRGDSGAAASIDLALWKASPVPAAGGAGAAPALYLSVSGRRADLIGV
jgi:hypothetical protein